MTPFVQETAENDILEQIEWYAGQGVPDVARRFSAAVGATIKAILQAPDAGAPRLSAHLRLQGLRTWPVKGFEAFRIYYLKDADMLLVVRVLHSKRDTEAILVGGIDR